jgi:hypothetical protein
VIFSKAIKTEPLHLSEEVLGGVGVGGSSTVCLGKEVWRKPGTGAEPDGGVSATVVTSLAHSLHNSSKRLLLDGASPCPSEIQSARIVSP